MDAGSRLAQFLVERNGDGSPVDESIGVIWIDLTKPEPPHPQGKYGHCCKGPFYRVVDRDIGTASGYRPVVCLCMGRFIE